MLVDAAFGASSEFKSTVSMFGPVLGVAITATTKVWLLNTIERRHDAPLSAQDLGVKLGRGAFRRLTWRVGPGEKLSSRLASRRVKVVHDDGTDAGERKTDPAGTEALAPRHDAAVLRDGFNLHASITVAASDDLGRERLCRYGLRPPFSPERFRRLPDGRISYRVKKSSRHISRCRVMTRIDCIEGICALIRPPRYLLTHFHGVFVLCARLRPRIVSRPPTTFAHPLRKPRGNTTAAARASHAHRRERHASHEREGPVVPNEAAVSAGMLARVLLSAEIPAPNVLSATYLARLRGGLLYAVSSNIPWALLLARTFDVNMSVCPQCQARLDARAVIHDQDGIRRMLTSLAALARVPPGSDAPIPPHDLALA